MGVSRIGGMVLGIFDAAVWQTLVIIASLCSNGKIIDFFPGVYSYLNWIRSQFPLSLDMLTPSGIWFLSL